MSVLLVIGFIALLVIATVLTFATFVALAVSQGFSGKTDESVYGLSGLAATAWFLVYETWPFDVILKVV